MKSILIALTAILILIPFIITFGIIVSMRGKRKSIQRVVGYAADWTTPLLFLSVYVITTSAFGQGKAVIIVGAALSVGILYALIERIRVKDFQIVRFLRKMWRLFFLLLSGTYVILLLVAFFLSVLTYIK